MIRLIVFLLISITTFAQDKIEVYFDFNNDIPNLKSTEEFNIWLNENKDAEVYKISGYCDSVDNSKYNKDLAARRIKAVVENLEMFKIKISSNVRIENNGKDFKQSKNQAENRKVVIYYQKLNSEEQLSTKVKISKIGDLIKLKNLYFFNNSDKIVPKSEPVLKELLKIMNDNPKLKIEIQGHICCKKPTDEDLISSARAKAVYNYLTQNKINKNRMTYKGYGVSKPVFPIPEKNTQEENENRRVEIMIVEN